MYGIAAKQLEEELQSEIKDSNNILNKQINTYENTDYIEVEVIYEVLEDIGREEKIIF